MVHIFTQLLTKLWLEIGRCNILIYFQWFINIFCKGWIGGQSFPETHILVYSHPIWPVDFLLYRPSNFETLKTDPICGGPKGEAPPGSVPPLWKDVLALLLRMVSADGLRPSASLGLSQGHRAVLPKDILFPRYSIFTTDQDGGTKAQTCEFNMGQLWQAVLALELTSHGVGRGCVRAQFLLPILLAWPPSHRCWPHRYP